MGDFNYRLNATEEQIREKIDDPISLLQYDQLLQSIDNNKAFSGFIESQISFKTTYKDVKNSDEYDWKRTPAWCDRILFRVCQMYHLSILKYNTIDIKCSDHLPTRCLCSIKPRKIIQETIFEAWDDILDMVNILSNELVPKCELSTRELQLGEVRPYKTCKGTVQMKNMKMNLNGVELLK